MRFTKKSYSIRKGIIKIEDLLQKNSLNESTKVRIADYLVRFKNLIFNDSYNYEEKPNYKSFKNHIFLTTLNIHPLRVIDYRFEYIYDLIIKLSYDEVFSFCEEIYSYFETNEIEYHANIIWQNILNTLFEEEHVCHRMVNGFITDVLDDTEITSINNAIESQDNVSSRMQKALKALYKDNDTQTAIRESIEAVEAMCKTKTNSTSGTLANAIDQLRRENKIHPALADGLKKIYGFTSDTVRHASGQSETPPTKETAQFMVLFCSNLINYIKTI